jgi:signal transduction histidine kinase
VQYKALADELAASNRSLREAEKQVQRAERLAALGQLTAGLAHELRNPLGTIKASADMLEKSLPQQDEIARELSGYISSEVDRTNSLVSRFLDFARPLELRPGVTDLGEVLTSAVRATRLDAESQRVNVTLQAPPEAIRFSLDAELMERVFVNLILNAIQASSPGSGVALELEQQGSNAIVRVIDHGEGIDPERREAIFNPFVTTKASGTGLGLAIVAKIVDEHRGKIHVQSNPGEGSVFTVTIPMSADA